ncbi:hypothetical protein RRG08_037350 [Elysia crispata]|uniref:Uncharacterized protein n=1 Tax=Elysia crispata TaxID=231223 RepID=A0AAE1ACR6_9GAST|nr:hypothetical protein RRG08_037350 [Elysia crispata]
MKFSVMLAIFLSGIAVASAFVDREACRREWCADNKIHKTTINGKAYCCIDDVHRYMIVEFIPEKDGRVVKKCFCRVN